MWNNIDRCGAILTQGETRRSRKLKRSSHTRRNEPLAQNISESIYIYVYAYIHIKFGEATPHQIVYMQSYVYSLFPKWLNSYGRGLLLNSWSCEVGGGGRTNLKKAIVCLDRIQKWRSGAAPAPPNGVRISETPYGGGKGHLLQASPNGNRGGANENRQSGHPFGQGWVRAERITRLHKHCFIAFLQTQLQLYVKTKLTLKRNGSSKIVQRF